MSTQFPGYTLSFVQSMLTEQAGQASGWFKDLELRTVFQPAFSLPHKKAVGFQANLRGADEDGSAVDPAAMFGPVDNFSETCLLDLLGATMHVHNFASSSNPPGLLFLNLHPEVFLDHAHSAQFLGTLFEHYGIARHRVVLDIPAYLLKLEQLDAAAAEYRALGCLICIDDLGIEDADMDTVIRTGPDIVKIDHGVVAGAVANESVRKRLLHAVSLLHEMGTLVLLERLESESEALMAIEADADLASGFYFGPLYDNVGEYDDPGRVLDDLWDRYKEKLAPDHALGAQSRTVLDEDALHSSHIKKLRSASPGDIHRYRDERRPFIAAIQHADALMQEGADFDTACRDFLKLDGAIRCFLLGGDGGQIGAELAVAGAPAPQAVNFSDLIEHVDGDWSRRDFFRRAMQEPEVVQVTRRYRSLAGYAHCVTFSIATTVDGKPVVICGDVDWSTHANTH
ncbi:MAG: EAL domain-containing protein [Betaproteobacteria bacterium]|jgi:EAL domain-containing protein (putative c-di-GMP-specific phosphodiesterase class I)